MRDTTDILDWLLKKACAGGADAADVVLFKDVDVSMSRRMGKQEGLERSEHTALGLRVLVGQRQALVSATELSREALAELAGRAVAMAKAAPADPHAALAPDALYETTPPDLDLLDDAEPDAAWLADQCRRSEEAALSVPGIVSSEGTDAGYGKREITLAIANRQGMRFVGHYATSRFSLSAVMRAGTGTEMERDDEFTSARHRIALASPESIGLEASRRVLARLHPRKVSTCRVPVVFDPRVSRSLVSTLAGSISGSAIARGSSFLKDAMGEQLFKPGVTVIDDPHRRQGFGSRPFDAEGVRGSRLSVVENGVLTTWLLDLRTASKLGLTTTGHASRGVASPPSPSSTNFYMESGALTPDALMADIRSGLYVTETFGMGINTVTGDYSQGAAGFWIENGQIAYPVSEITIAGQLRDMYKNLLPANDLTFRYATNAPTARVEAMTVAGA